MSISQDVLKIFFKTPGLVNIRDSNSIEVQPGVFSSIYINLKSPLSDFKSRKRFCSYISKKISNNADYICGIESGSNYFASAVADLTRKKLIFYRKEIKKYNIKNRFVGILPKANDHIVVVDDVVSSGNTIASVVRELKKIGCRVEVIIIFSYCWDKVISKNLDVRIRSLVNAFQFIDYGLSRKLISEKNAEMIRDYVRREEARVYKAK